MNPIDVLILVKHELSTVYVGSNIMKTKAYKWLGIFLMILGFFVSTETAKLSLTWASTLSTFDSSRAEQTCQATFARFSPDGNRVLTDWLTPPYFHNEIRLWDIQTGTPKVIQRFFGRTDSVVFNPTFSPQGDLILAGYNSEAILWDAKIGTQVHVFPRDVENPTDVTQASFSQDGKHIVTSGYEGANIWDVKSGQRLKRIRAISELSLSQLSSDSKYLLTIGQGGGIGLWDIPREQQIYTSGDTFNAILSPDTEWLATSGYDGLSLRKVNAFENMRILDTQVDRRHLEFSLDSQYLLTSDSRFEKLTIWDVSTKDKIWTFEGDVMQWGFFSNSNHILIVNGNPRTDITELQIWDPESKTIIKKITVLGYGSVHDISANGKYLLGFFDPSEQLWNLETGEKLSDFCH